jgi:hypothetical protein
MDMDGGNKERKKGQGQKRLSSLSKAGTERSAQSRKVAKDANVASLVDAKVLYVLDTHEPNIFPIEIGPDYPDDSLVDVNMFQFLQSMARATAGNRNDLRTSPTEYTQLNFDALKVAGVDEYREDFNDTVTMGDYIEWEDFVREVIRDEDLVPIISENDTYNPPFGLLMAISHQHAMRKFLISMNALDPKIEHEAEGKPLIYVTLDTTFRNAIHANPEQLTTYLRDSIDVVVLCNATNFLKAPKIGATPANIQFLETYMTFLSRNVVCRADCKTYPPLGLLNFLHDKLPLTDALNQHGLKIPNCYMALPNDTITTFRQLYHHLTDKTTPFPDALLDELEHSDEDVELLWKEHARTTGFVCKPLFGTLLWSWSLVCEGPW